MKSGSLAALLGAAAILMTSGAVHIVSIVLLPFVAPADAFARVAAFAPVASMRVLPRASLPGDPLPGRDPALATAICRYDLARGPLRVSAAVGSASFVALAIHSRTGLAFYGLNDRAGNDGKLDLVLMTSTQLDRAAAADVEDAPVRDVRVVAPEDEGFVTLDVLSRIGGYAQSAQDLSSMSCKVERQP